jgi:hypothetical protein
MSNPESKPEHGFIYPPEKIMIRVAQPKAE